MGRPKLPPKHLINCRLDAATTAFLGYVRDRVSSDSGTPEAKAVILRGLVECLGAARPVWTLTSGDFDDALQWIVKGASPEEAAQRKAQGRRSRAGRKTEGSIGSVATALRQFAEYARRHRWLDSNVTLEKEIVTSAKARLDGAENPEAAEMLRIPADQWGDVLTLAGAIHARCRMAVALGLYCARRVSEAVHVQWRHIDWQREEIRFYNKKRGRWLIIPLFAEIEAELTLWREWAEAEYGPVQDDWYLVPNRVANPRGVNSLVILRREPRRWPVQMTAQSRPETVISDVRRLLGGLGVGPNQGTGTHTWRRSAAQAFVREHGLLATQALLDHDSIVSTQIYTGKEEGRALLRAALTGSRTGRSDRDQPSNVVAIRRRAS